MLERGPADTFGAGTLAGAGCFRCRNCDFPVALHERDQVPECPHCGSTEFRRSSIFGDRDHAQEPIGMQDVGEPGWLAETRAALDRDGDYMAFDDGDGLRVVALAEGWTRIGRSLTADLRFDDPTVSRRHAMLQCRGGVVRILDDRSLNGVFVNGERADLRELDDGDEVTIGRFRLYFVRLRGIVSRAPERTSGAFA